MPSPARTSPEPKEMEEIGSQQMELSEMIEVEVKKTNGRGQGNKSLKCKKEMMIKIKDIKAYVEKQIEDLRKTMGNMNAKFRQ